VNLLDFYSYRFIGKLTAFFAASGVQSSQFERDQFHFGRAAFYFRRAAFSQHLQNKVGLDLAKAVDLRINLNIDGAPIASKSHTHPSHRETDRFFLHLQEFSHRNSNVTSSTSTARRSHSTSTAKLVWLLPSQ
jgi:hypothetical protein